MTLYYYMYRSWQDCCRRGENRSWPSVSVDSECWCLNNAIVYTFIMQLTVEEHVLQSTFKLNAQYKRGDSVLGTSAPHTPRGLAWRGQRTGPANLKFPYRWNSVTSMCNATVYYIFFFFFASLCRLKHLKIKDSFLGNYTV